MSLNAIARWALLAALAGVAGNRADDALTDLIDWLVRHITDEPTPSIGPHVIHQANQRGKLAKHDGHNHDHIVPSIGAAVDVAVFGGNEAEHMAHAIEHSFQNWF
jgi:hypothetical protein